MNFRYVAIAAVAAAALFPASGMAQTREEVTIGLASTSIAAASGRIAHQMGLFQKHGFDAKFVVLDNANATMAALISRSLKVVVAGAGELVVAQARGQKVVAIASVYGGFAGSLVISKEAAEKSGVKADAPAIDRLKALEGLIIGAPSPTGAYTIAYGNAAKSVGVNVRFTYMSQSAMPAAFESGAIQGFIGSAPFWGYPILKGNGVMWMSGPKGDLPAQFAPTHTASLQILRETAEANPEFVKRLVAVFADLGKAVEERPAEVKAAVAKVYPDMDPTMLDLVFATEALGWKARPLTREDIIHEIGFVKASGTPLPDIDKLDPRTFIFP